MPPRNRNDNFTPLSPEEIESVIDEELDSLGPFSLDDDDDDDFDLEADRRRESPLSDDDDDDFQTALAEEEEEQAQEDNDEEDDEEDDEEEEEQPSQAGGSQLSGEELLAAVNQDDVSGAPPVGNKLPEDWSEEEAAGLAAWLGQEPEAGGFFDDFRLTRGGGAVENLSKDALLFMETLSRSFLENLSPTASLSDPIEAAINIGEEDASLEGVAASALGEGMGTAMVVGTTTGAGALAGSVVPGIGTVGGAIAGGAAGGALMVIQGARREANSAKEQALYLGLEEEEAERIGDRMFYASLGIEMVGAVPLFGYVGKSILKKANGIALRTALKSSAEEAGETVVKEGVETAAETVAKQAGKTAITVEGAESGVDAGTEVFREGLDKVGKTTLAVRAAQRLANSKVATLGGAAAGESVEELLQHATSEGLLASEVADTSFVDEFTDNLMTIDALYAAIGGGIGGATGAVAGRGISDAISKSAVKSQENRVKDEAMALLEIEAKGAEATAKEQELVKQVGAIDKAIDVLNSDANDVNEVVIDTPGVSKEMLNAAIALREEPGVFVSTTEDGRLVLKRAEPIEPIDIVERSFNEERAELLKELEEADQELQSGREKGFNPAGKIAARDSLIKRLENLDESLDIVSQEREMRDNNRRLSKISDQIARNPNDSEALKEEAADLIEANKKIREALRGRTPELTSEPKTPKTAFIPPKSSKEAYIERQTKGVQELFGEELNKSVEDLTLGEARAQQRKLLQLDQTDNFGRKVEGGRLAAPELKQRLSDLDTVIGLKEEEEAQAQARAKTEEEQRVQKERENEARARLSKALSGVDVLDLFDQDNPNYKPSQAKKELKELYNFEKGGFKLTPEEAQRYEELAIAQDLYDQQLENEQATKDAEAQKQSEEEQQRLDEERAAEEEKLAREREEQEIAIQEFEDERTIFTDRGYRSLSPETKKHVGRNATLARLRRSLETAKSNPRKAALQEAIEKLEQDENGVVKVPRNPQAVTKARDISDKIAEVQKELDETRAERDAIERQPEDSPERQDLPAFNKRIAVLEKRVVRLKANKRKQTKLRARGRTKAEEIRNSFRITEEMSTRFDKLDGGALESNPATGDPFLEQTSFLVYSEEGRSLLSEFMKEEFNLPNLDATTLTPEEGKTIEKRIETKIDDTSRAISPRAVKYSLHKVGKILTDRIKFEHKKFDKPGLLGVFNKVSMRIQTLKHSSNATLAHEVGHGMFQTFIGTGQFSVDALKANPQMVQELTELARALYPKLNAPEGQLTEGFAEFFRHYTQDPAGIEKLKKRAPATSKFFENQMLPSIPGLKEAVDNAAKLGRMYNSLDPLGLTQAQIAAYNYVPIRQIFEEKVNRMMGLSKDAVRVLYDTNLPAHIADAQVKAILGELPMGKRIGQVIDASRRLSDAVLTSWVRRVPVDQFGIALPGTMNFVEALSPIKNVLVGVTPEQRKLHKQVLSDEQQILDTRKEIEKIQHDLKKLRNKKFPEDATRSQKAMLLQQQEKEVTRLENLRGRAKAEIRQLKERVKEGRKALPKNTNFAARKLLEEWLFSQRTLQEWELHQRRIAEWNKGARAYVLYQRKVKEARKELSKAKRRWADKGGIDRQGNKIPQPKLVKIKEVKHPGARPVYRETGIPVENAQKVIARIDLEAPEIAIAGRAIETWFNGVMNVAASYSPVMAKKIAAIREANGTEYVYVPLIRAMYNDVNATKRRVDTDLEFGDPIKGLYKVAHAFLQMGVNQMRMDVVSNLAQDPRVHSIFTPLDDAHTRRILEKHGFADWEAWVNDQVRQYNLDFNQDANAKEVSGGILNTLFQRVGVLNLTDDIHGVAIPIQEWNEEKQNYTTRLYSMDKELAENLVGVDARLVGKFTQIMDALADWVMPGTDLKPFSVLPQWFKIGATGLNPIFAYGNNLLIDVQSFLRNSENEDNWIMKLVDWGTQLTYLFLNNLVPDRIKPLLTDFFPEGANVWDDSEFTSFLYGSSIDQAAFLTDEAQTENYLKRISRPKIRSFLNFGGEATDYTTELFKAAEMASRAAEVKLSAKKMGVDFLHPISQDQFVALATAGKNITVDFTRGGSFSRAYNRIKPFWNASMQGNLTAVRNFKKNPGRYLSRSAILGAASIYMWTKVKDKEWYKEYLSPYKYMHNWFEIENEDGSITVGKYRIGHMEAFFFEVLPRLFLDEINADNPELADTLGKVFFESLLPVNFYSLAFGEKEEREDELVAALPHIMTAIAETFLTKRDSFYGSSLVDPFQLANPSKSEHRVYRPYSTKTAKWLSENLFTGLYPAQIENLIQKTGGTAMINVIHDAERLGGWKAQDPENLHATRNKSAVNFKQVFFQHGGEYPARSRSIRELKMNLRALNIISGNAKDDAKKGIGEGETEEQVELRLQTRDAVKAISLLNKVAQNLATDKDIAAIRKQMVAIAKEANSAVNKQYANREIFKEHKDYAKEIHELYLGEPDAK